MLRTMKSPIVWFVLALGGVAGPAPTSAQGRCMTTYGSAACNADIPPVFAPTGWTTIALDHVTFEVADYKKEAAFYIAVMGWTLRRDDGMQAVMDIGNWGTVIFRQGPAEQPAATGDNRARRAVATSFGFAIEPWDARKVASELRGRGLSSVADNDGSGFESFHVKDPDGFDLQIGNGNGHVRSRKTPATAPLSEPLPFQPTGWKTVWLDHLSFGVKDYKVSASFYRNLLGWKPTYDSYHTDTPNGYNLQISYVTHDNRLALGDAVNPQKVSGSR